jgi:hypothetical protein
MRKLLFVLFLLFVPALAGALDGVLLRSDGSPAAGYQVSVVGFPISVTADEAGRFRISPDPVLPFRLVATSPGGEVSAPIEIAALPEAGALEAAIQATFQDSVTVVSGVAPGLETPPAAATTIIGQEDLEQRLPHRLVDARASPACRAPRRGRPACPPSAASPAAAPWSCSTARG